MIDLLHNVPFVMGSDYKFDDRFDGRDQLFRATNSRKELGGFINWETNFIADARGALVDPSEAKGFGVKITSFDMGGSTLVGHIAEWPVGRYHKAHFHQGGAILLILRSEGYTLMWPQEAGLRPYRNGNGDKVVRVDWREGSVFSPPSGWFHQHFNTGNEQARQLAFRYSGQSGKYLLGCWRAINKEGVRTSTREGGTLIEYEDEDPQMRIDFEAAINKLGVADGNASIQLCQAFDSMKILLDPPLYAIFAVGSCIAAFGCAPKHAQVRPRRANGTRPSSWPRKKARWWFRSQPAPSCVPPSSDFSRNAMASMSNR